MLTALHMSVAAIMATFLLAVAPQILLLALVLLSIECAVLAAAAQPANWMPYALVLAFLGGLLVLFTYVSSLSPNPRLPEDGPTTKAALLAVSITTGLTAMAHLHLPGTKIETWSTIEKSNNTAMMDLYSTGNSSVSMFLFLYLLLVLMLMATAMMEHSAPLRRSILQ